MICLCVTTVFESAPSLPSALAPPHGPDAMARSWARAVALAVLLVLAAAPVPMPVSAAAADDGVPAGAGPTPTAVPAAATPTRSAVGLTTTTSTEAELHKALADPSVTQIYVNTSSLVLTQVQQGEGRTARTPGGGGCALPL